MRTKTSFRCTECGADHPKWQGRCDACGEWNTLVEEVTARPSKSATARATGPVSSIKATRLRDVGSARTSRVSSGIGELDFVLGGGVVPGSMILVGGEPGIGKSTLLLQVAGAVAARGSEVLYVSGEESALQVKLRAERLAVGEDVSLLCATALEEVLQVATETRPGLMIVDSIQTVATSELEGAPGNVGQVRECAAQLMRYAKTSGAAVVVVGHVTKGGGIAGPKTLEHIVDTVLYFEGEGTADHRVLRATKNRFGSVDEIGVFRMTEEGLVGVANPSALFLADRETRTSGSAVTSLMEGTRPVLVEVQALAAKAGFGTPQRVATGFDGRRLALLLAVLDKRCGLSYASLDVFLNVVGGLRMVEPSGDLAVAAALASSVYDRALGADAVFVGEVGLGGEVRPVSQVDRRLAEAAQLGFTTAYVASRGLPRRTPDGLKVVGVDSLRALFERLFG
ncbi:MAG: DNA repair protein RadA [Cytophagaceae bacterium]|nr:DNA repair protein RadA [Gemmatimonadaceae bacterium]